MPKLEDDGYYVLVSDQEILIPDEVAQSGNVQEIARYASDYLRFSLFRHQKIVATEEEKNGE